MTTCNLCGKGNNEVEFVFRGVNGAVCSDCVELLSKELNKLRLTKAIEDYMNKLIEKKLIANAGEKNKL